MLLLLVFWPVGLGMIALPVRTWMGSMVGGGVVVGRTTDATGAAVGELPPPHATSATTARIARRAGAFRADEGGRIT
jgi:hypothetical protein